MLSQQENYILINNKHDLYRNLLYFIIKSELLSYNFADQ